MRIYKGLEVVTDSSLLILGNLAVVLCIVLIRLTCRTLMLSLVLSAACVVISRLLISWARRLVCLRTALRIFVCPLLSTWLYSWCNRLVHLWTGATGACSLRETAVTKLDPSCLVCCLWATLWTATIWALEVVMLICAIRRLSRRLLSCLKEILMFLGLVGIDMTCCMTLGALVACIELRLLGRLILATCRVVGSYKSILLRRLIM